MYGIKIITYLISFIIFPLQKKLNYQYYKTVAYHFVTFNRDFSFIWRSEPKGTRTKGTRTKGTRTKGTRTKGTRTKGTRTKGTRTKGTRTKGTRTKGTRTKGTRTKGTRMVTAQQ